MKPRVAQAPDERGVFGCAVGMMGNRAMALVAVAVAVVLAVVVVMVVVDQLRTYGLACQRAAKRHA